jgi:Heme oxygenase
MNLGKGEGLAFYDFAEIPSAKKFKDEYRAALDALDLTDAEIDRLVAEANVAFLLNMRLFEELDVQANVPGAKVRALEEALACADTAKIQHDTSNECPFLASNKTAEAVKTSEECPFANPAQAAVKRGRCLWPFIILHDPKASLKDWQTWTVIGLLLCWVWSKLQ